MSVVNYSEDAIVEGCLQGNRLFQKILYERYYGSMMTVCARYASDREEARDLLHEGFMKVFLSLQKFEQGSNLGGWIRRVMVNTAIDSYRRSAKIPPMQEVNLLIHESSDSYDVVTKMSAEEILGLVQTLPISYRTIFNMYVMDGYSHREIAQILGVSEGTSKSSLSKARFRLQKMITDIQNQEQISINQINEKMK